MTSRTSTAAMAVGMMMALLASSAIAQVPGGAADQDVGVMDRARPAYDAKGVPLGGFRLYPEITETGSYDDNVFRTNDAKSDYFFVTAPSLRLQSQWGRHFVEVYGGLNNFNYVEYTDENLTDWKLGTDGRVDISRSANLTIGGFYGGMHELWSAPNSIAGYQAAPNRYFQAHADAAAVYQPNRLGFGIGAAFDNYNWISTPRIGGGHLYNDDRDQNEYQTYAKIYYDFSPGYSGYVKASYDERDFSMFYDRSGSHRSSHGYRIDGGLSLQITHLVAGEIYAGYLQQNFSQNVPAPLKNVAGFDYGVRLDWYLSEVLTLHLTGKRSLDDVTLSTISFADNKSVGLSADYEFRPNIILQARASYTNVKYIGSTRSDDYPAVGIGVRYLLTEYASFGFNYDYSQRSTSVSALKYTDNLVSIGVTLHI